MAAARDRSHAQLASMARTLPLRGAAAMRQWLID
jgi:hypothetical protein